MELPTETCEKGVWKFKKIMRIGKNAQKTMLEIVIFVKTANCNNWRILVL